MTAKIIVAAHGDDESSRSAVALGCELADAYDGELVLAGLWVSPLGAGDGLFELFIRDGIKRELEQLATTVPAGISCRRLVKGTHSLMSGLSREAQELAADFIVFGPAHVARGPSRLLGEKPMGAIHMAAATVAVDPKGHTGRGDRDDVLVGWDESGGAVAALEEGIRLVQWTGGVLRIVCVLESPFRFTDAFMSDPTLAAGWSDELERWINESLETALASVDGRVPATTAMAEGQAGIRLAELGGEAAFILTGSSGHGPITRAMVGSTSVSLLHHATVPVIVMCRG